MACGVRVLKWFAYVVWPYRVLGLPYKLICWLLHFFFFFLNTGVVFGRARSHWTCTELKPQRITLAEYLD